MMKTCSAVVRRPRSEAERLSRKRGSVSVLLCILLVLFLTAEWAAVEAASLTGSAALGESALKLAGKTLLTEYSRELHQRYGLFGITMSEEQAVEKAQKDMAVFFKAEDDGLNLLQLRTKELQADFSGYSLQCTEVLKNQILRYMKYAFVQDVTQELFFRNESAPGGATAGTAAEAGIQVGRTLRNDSVIQRLPTVKYGIAAGGLPTLKTLPDLDRLLGSSVDQVMINAYLLKKFGCAKNSKMENNGSGKTSTASGKTSTASEKTSTASGKTSTANGKTSTASGKTSTASGKTSTASEKTSTASGKTPTANEKSAPAMVLTDRGSPGISVSEFPLPDGVSVPAFPLPDSASPAGSPAPVDSAESSDPSFFINEIEYVLGGHYSDEKNLSAVRTVTIVFRSALNLAYIYSVPEMYQTVLALASVLTPGPEAAATAVLLATLWAGAEAACDWNSLMAGDGVPLWKDPTSWHLSLQQAFSGAYAVDERSSEGARGLTYDRYLFLYLFFLDEQTKLVRTMDLIQLNMQGTCDESFTMERCAAGITLSAQFQNQGLAFGSGMLRSGERQVTLCYDEDQPEE